MSNIDNCTVCNALLEKDEGIGIAIITQAPRLSGFGGGHRHGILLRETKDTTALLCDECWERYKKALNEFGIKWPREDTDDGRQITDD